MPTPAEVTRLLADEASVEERHMRFARASDQVREDRLLKRHIEAQIAASVHPSSLLPTIAALSPHERRMYSVAALVNSMMKPGKAELTLEREISLSISKDIGQQPMHGGHWIPLRIRAAGLDTKTNAAGAGMVGTKVGDIIDSLRNQARILQLGGRLLTGLRFATQFPVEASIMAATWMDENSGSDLGESNSAFAARSLVPHSLAATTSLSRQLLQQSSADLEGWIRDRIGKAFALALDTAAINGPGSSSQPIGLLKVPGIGDVAIGSTGGAPTLDKLLDLEDVVGAANASDSCAWLTTSRMRKKLRKLSSLASGSMPLWSDAGVMLGYPAFTSAQCPTTLVKGANSDCHPIIFGDFSTVLLGEFEGALEILTDVFTDKRRGNVQICSWGTFDCLLTQPPALAVIQDARDV